MYTFSDHIDSSVKNVNYWYFKHLRFLFHPSPPSCFSLNMLMLSSGGGKLRPKLSHVSMLLPPQQYVLQLCKLPMSRFLLSLLSKLFHISVHAHRNTEHQSLPTPGKAFLFQTGIIFLCSPSIRQWFKKENNLSHIANVKFHFCLVAQQRVAFKYKTWSERDAKKVTLCQFMLTGVLATSGAGLLHLT